MIRLGVRLEDFHQYQAQTNDCAPFTTAMIVHALTGRKLEGPKLAQKMNRPRLRAAPLPVLVIRRIPNWATFPWGIVDELSEHGVRARWRFGGTPDDLRRALQENRIAMPIVGQLLHRQDGRLLTWAHVKPLAAYDDGQGWGFVDPALPQPITWQSEAEFTALWKTYGRLLVETL